MSFRSSMRTLVSNRNLLALTLAQSLTMLAMFLWRPYWGLYILELGGTPSILGALATLQAASMLLLQLPGGLLADRYGRRRIILVASAAGLLPPLIFRLSTHWTMLIPGIVATPAPLVGGYLYENLSPESPFFASFLLGMLGLVIFILFVKEPDDQIRILE